MRMRDMRNRMVGLFGIFIPMTILGSLLTMAAPCMKAKSSVAPTTQTQVARPDSSEAHKVDCAKAEVKKTGDVCKEPPGAV